MDIGGFFTNWGNWSPDKDRNEALNQAVTLFGANMLAGSGGRGNFSSILGRSVGAGVEGFNEAQNAQLKRALTKSQIEENTSQQEFRRAQVEEQRRKAALAAQIQQMRMNVFAKQPGQAALESQAAGGRAGPTRAAQAQAEGFAQNGVPISWEDLAPLAAIGGLDATDVAYMGKRLDPKTFAPGSMVERPGQQPFIVPKVPDGVNAQVGPGGGISRVSPIPGATDAVAGNAAAEAGGKAAGALPYVGMEAEARAAGTQRGELPFVGPRAFAQNAGEQSARSMFDLVDVPQPDGTTLKLPRSMVLGMGGATGSPGNLTGGIPMPGSAAQPPGQLPGGVGVRAGIPTDTAARTAAGAEFTKQWVTKTYPEVQNAGMTAKSTINQMDAISRLTLTTGWTTPAIAKLGSVLAGFGIAPDSLKGIATQAQVFDKFANDGVLTAQIAQAGPQTESDAQRMRATLPQLGNTPAANALISSYIKAGAQMQVEKAKFFTNAYRMYQQGQGSVEQIQQAWDQSGLSLWSMPAMREWERSFPAARPTAEIPR
jgi:hypothetical protein